MSSYNFDYSQLENHQPQPFDHHQPQYHTQPEGLYYPPPSSGALDSYKPSKTKHRSHNHSVTFLDDPTTTTAAAEPLETAAKPRKHKSSKHHHSSSSSSKSKSDKHKEKDRDPSKKSKKSKSKKRHSSSDTDSSTESTMSSMSMQSVSSSLSTLAGSHKVQLAATALVSGLVVGGTIIGYQTSRRKEKVRSLKESIPPTPAEPMSMSMSSSASGLGGSMDLSGWLAHSTTPSPRGGGSSAVSGPQRGGGGKNGGSGDAAPTTSITDEESTALARAAQSLASKNKPIPEPLIMEQLTRTHSFLGTEGLRTVRSSFVIVVGLGGVGSWCTTMLVRSGIGRVRLIDFDQVTLSSLNRHAVATLEDVGTPKVLAMQKRLKEVAPWVEVEACVEMWTEADAGRLLGGDPDWVVDAIDNVDTKVDLLAYCHERGLKVIGSMGAGCKSDPTRICVGDISETTEDPLSKVTRRKLRQKGIATGISVIYSTEKPGPGKAQLLPLADEEHAKGAVGELSVLENFRVRILPVLGTMPATFGLAAANHVLCMLAKYPLEYLPANTRFRPQFYGQVVNQLLAVESRIRNNVPGLKVPISEADAGYIMEEIFAGRSAVSGLTHRLHLVRWNPLFGGRFEDGSTGVEGEGQLSEKEAKARMEKIGVGVDGAIEMKLTDLVCLTKEELKVHEKRVLIGGESPEAVWGKEAQELVERKWAEEKEFGGWRD